MDSNGIVRTLIRDRAKLLGYIWAIVRDHHLADDIYQDVTVLAIERAAEINDGEHLLLWARKAARFKALETLRSKAHHMVTLDADVLEMLEAEWSWSSESSCADEVEHLRACVEKLTPRAQRILHLRYSEGATGIQAAEIFKVKVRSVYVALSRIHETLQECIRRRLAEGAHV